jgi:phosphate transport system protein
MSQIRHFDLEIADLKRSLAGMGSLVQKTLDMAVEAVLAPTIEARERARSYEDQLDKLDSDIEERCHQILALQSPMAGDLRLLVSAMRVTLDLENIGDLAESLAKRATAIARQDRVVNPAVLEPLGRLALDMLRRAIQVFIAGDVEGGKRLVADEAESDRMTKAGYAELQGRMRDDTAHIDEYLHLHRALSHLEHICDLALSIAEEAVYAHRGKLVRHHRDELEREL